MAPWSTVSVAVQEALQVAAGGGSAVDVKDDHGDDVAAEFVDLGAFMEDHEDVFQQQEAARANGTPIDDLDGLNFQFHKAKDLEAPVTRQAELLRQDEEAARSLKRTKSQLRRASLVLKTMPHDHDVEDVLQRRRRGEERDEFSSREASSESEESEDEEETVERHAMIERVTVPFRHAGYAAFLLLTLCSVVVLYLVASRMQSDGSCNSSGFRTTFIVLEVVWDFFVCQSLFVGLSFVYHFLVSDAFDPSDVFSEDHGSLMRALLHVRMPAHPCHGQQLLYIPPIPRNKGRGEEEEEGEQGVGAREVQPEAIFDGATVDASGLVLDVDVRE